MKIRFLLLSTLVLSAGSVLAEETVAATPLVATVRSATERFRDIETAKAAGYALFHGCVSGPEEGAMGLHFANGELVGDGALDAQRPEALLYELRDGRMQLTGVEYLVLAEAWNAKHQAPPVLGGQLFNLVGSPNRYGLPPFYELHVWAWKKNPKGTFTDFNPAVSCDAFAGVDSAEASGHH